MHKVKLEDLDNLYFLVLELGAISYLQDLAEHDCCSNSLFEQELLFAKNHAKIMLLDMQIELVAEVYKLLNHKDFSESLTTAYKKHS